MYKTVPERQITAERDGETSNIVDEEQFDADNQLFIELVYTPFATYSEEVLGEALSPDVQDAFAEIYDSLGY